MHNSTWQFTSTHLNPEVYAYSSLHDSQHSPQLQTEFQVHTVMHGWFCLTTEMQTTEISEAQWQCGECQPRNNSHMLLLLLLWLLFGSMQAWERMKWANENLLTSDLPFHIHILIFLYIYILTYIAHSNAAYVVGSHSSQI